MLLQTWESVDKIVRKDIIQPGPFSKKPTECASCEIIIENIHSPDVLINDLKDKFHSKILENDTEKSLVIGEAQCELDRQIERALQMMMVLEKSLITLHATLEGFDRLVVIKFEMTLIKMKPYRPIWEWKTKEKYAVALKYKNTGVYLFKESRWVDAFHKFSKACKILITLEPIPDLELDATLKSDINNLRLILYNNMAGCQLNCKNYDRTISLCTKVLDKETNNVKALYRRGVAYGNLRDLDKAVADLKIVVTLEPHNRAAKEQFLFYNGKLEDATQKFENMVRRMFKT